MCPALPDDIVMRPFSTSSSLVQSRIIISRTFQREMGSLAMGRFISYAGNSLSNVDMIFKMYEGLLKAYTYFVGLSFILNYAGQWIYRSPELKDWFSQWEMTKNYFTLRESQKWAQYQSGDWSFYRDWILSHLGYDKSLYDEFNPRESLLNVERYKCSRLLNSGVGITSTAQELINLAGAPLKATAQPEHFFYVQPEGVPLVSVFIGLDITILFSNVYSFEIYKRIVEKGLSGGRIPAWLKSQSTRVSDSTGELAKVYFDGTGNMRVTIPAVDDAKHHVEFDTYGLKFTLDLSRLRLELRFCERWELEDRENRQL